MTETPMLERLVKAGRAAQAMPGHPDRVVRAILTELREPSEAVLSCGAGELIRRDPSAAHRCLSVMIDAILEGKA